MNDPADMHTAVVEMPTRSKLSCLSWNKFTKNHIASTDYEGIVTVWDVDTRQVMIKITMVFNWVVILMYSYYYDLVSPQIKYSLTF